MTRSTVVPTRSRGVFKFRIRHQSHSKDFCILMHLVPYASVNLCITLRHQASHFPLSRPQDQGSSQHATHAKTTRPTTVVCVLCSTLIFFECWKHVFAHPHCVFTSISTCDASACSVPYATHKASALVIPQLTFTSRPQDVWLRLSSIRRPGEQTLWRLGMLDIHSFHPIIKRLIQALPSVGARRCLPLLPRRPPHA